MSLKLAAAVALTLAPSAAAVAQTPAGTADPAAAQAMMGAGQDLLTVIFEFTVDPAQQEELSGKIQPLVRDIVSRQPGFVSAHLHLSADGTKVLNYFQWESQAAFDAFRQDEALQQQIRPVIGPYGPTPRVYTVVYSAVAAD